jgi:hypothetical protein
VEFTLPSGVIFGSTITNFVGSLGTISIETIPGTENHSITVISTTVILPTATSASTNSNNNVFLTNSPGFVALSYTTGILGLYFVATIEIFLWRKFHKSRAIPTSGTS